MNILVIDNDPAMVKTIRDLSVQALPTIYYTNSSEDGFAKVKQLQPELILIGYNLDKLNGIDLCKRIRENCSVPLFIVSALDDPKLIIAALDAGADDYLIKPVSNRVLAAKINASARRYATKPLSPASIPY